MARTSCAKNLRLTSKDFSFCVELPIKAGTGYKIVRANHSKDLESLGKKGKCVQRWSKILLSMIKLFLDIKFDL